MTYTDDERHFMHYMVLLVGLFVFFVLFFLFRYNSFLQWMVGAGGCTFYVFWGVFHHALEHRLTSFVVMEYVLFGSLMLFLLTLVLMV